MEFHLTTKTGSRMSKVGMAILLLGMGSAQASTVDISFTDVLVQGNTNAGAPGTMASGTSVDLKISDTGTANVLQFTISTDLTGKEQLNRLYLDLPTVEAAALTGLSISNSTSTAATPKSFTLATTNNSVTGSEWAASQILVPNSATAAQTGKSDLLIAFTAGAISGSGGTGVKSETFDLTFSGATVTAADFLTLSSNNFNGFAEITLQGGTTGSGTGDLGGVNNQQAAGTGTGTPIPEPATIALLGLGFAGLAMRSRKA